MSNEWLDWLVIAGSSLALFGSLNLLSNRLERRRTRRDVLRRIEPPPTALFRPLAQHTDACWLDSEDTGAWNCPEHCPVRKRAEGRLLAEAREDP